MLILALNGVVMITLLSIIWNGNSVEKTFDAAKSLVAKIPSSLAKERDLSAFVATHEAIMDGLVPPRLSINFLEQNGYGNRMYSVITSFVIAVLSERALIVKWENIRPYIREPFKMSFHTFDGPNEFNIDFKPDEVILFPKCDGNWEIKKNLKELIKTRLPPMKAQRVAYVEIEGQFMWICSNPAFYEKLYEFGLVSRPTIDKASGLLNSTTAKNGEKIDAVLRVGFEVGSTFMNKYWTPYENVTSQVNYYYDKFFKDYYVIGLQIRVQFLEGVDFIKVFTDCAFKVEEKMSDDSKRVKWFVTSDSQQVINILRSGYPDKIIQVNGTIGHIDLDDKFFMKTLVDSELLARCQEIIMTGASTFGWLSTMKALHMPLFVEGTPNQTECRRATLEKPPTRLRFSAFK